MELASVTVDHGSFRALDRVSLVVAPGETLAVVGPSGSGKSTLLRAVAGLVPLAAGSISLGGRDLTGVPTHERGLGLMFQDNALFPHLNVAENVAYGLRMAGMAEGPRRERVGEVLAMVGLAAMADRSVQALSGGEAQRVALARALAPRPGLLMLDELLGSLDRALREELTGELRELLAQLDQTAIHVTHDQGEAFALADRVAVLMGGRLRQVGPPRELWYRPASVEVAHFVGHENEATMIVSEPVGTGVRSVLWNGVELGSVDEGRFPGSGPHRVIVPDRAIAETADGPVSLVVVSSVFDRGEYRVRATLNGADGGAELRFVTAGDRRPGSIVRVAIDLGRLLFFDR